MEDGGTEWSLSEKMGKRIRVPEELAHTDVLGHLDAHCEAAGVSREAAAAEAIEIFLGRLSSDDSEEPSEKPKDGLRMMRTCAYCEAGIGIKSMSEYAKLLSKPSSKCPGCHHHPGEDRPRRETALVDRNCLLPCRGWWSDGVRLPRRLLEQSLTPVAD